jgi:hypothetical protein
MKSKLQFTNPILALHKLIFLILPLAVALLTVPASADSFVYVINLTQQFGTVI